MPHPLNFTAGWWLILAGFIGGAIIGLGFHHPDFLGGYGSLRRRLLRLGHIALAALGMLNVLYGLSPVAAALGGLTAGHLLLAGSIAMPAVCLLAAWREPIRHLFFIPVLLLATAVIAIIHSPSP
ncbi:MAG TPA: hypothetical protein VG734_01195 [Lacunisphaera sp.]|nr:hypothetical protein [Lacunisphaera sp.]